ncbi:MAG: L-serine ammonia-lyase, iron-sulfur-dependent, subunit alpha [Clostridia bacterium]
MERNSALYQQYTNILREELVPAMGCTEPIAIAYAAAKCRALLSCMPERLTLRVSGSIIKNVKSVIVPNTGGRKGMEVAVAAGTVAGDEDAKLQVLANIQPEQHRQMERFLADVPIEIKPSCNGIQFYIDLMAFGKGHCSRVVIAYHHTNIVRIEMDGNVLLDLPEQSSEGYGTDRSVLTVAGICDYARTLAPEDVEPMIGRQIACNSALSQEGLSNPWGAQIGRILKRDSGGDVRFEARAAAAAGSDARMNGCELPAIILSGSGNQGLTATMPILVYGEHLHSTKEQILRALVLSDLITVHQKTGIGSVSAFCGAVCAGAGAGCGIALLQGADDDVICHTLVNTLAILSGMICDGAKSSCAAKISAAVDAGILGYSMYMHGQQFYGGDGIVKKGVEASINSVCEVAREGMRETNERILEVMLQK